MRLSWILLVLMIAIGCGSSEQKTKIVTQEEADRLREVEASAWEEVEHHEYDGHKYITFRYQHGWRNGTSATVHDPECPCHR